MNLRDKVRRRYQGLFRNQELDDQMGSEMRCRGGELILTGVGSAERVVAGAVTAEFFLLLGFQPARGRNFTRADVLGPTITPG